MDIDCTSRTALWRSPSKPTELLEDCELVRDSPILNGRGDHRRGGGHALDGTIRYRTKRRKSPMGYIGQPRPKAGLWPGPREVLEGRTTP